MARGLAEARGADGLQVVQLGGGEPQKCLPLRRREAPVLTPSWFLRGCGWGFSTLGSALWSSGRVGESPVVRYPLQTPASGLPAPRAPGRAGHTWAPRSAPGVYTARGGKCLGSDSLQTVSWGPRQARGLTPTLPAARVPDSRVSPKPSARPSAGSQRLLRGWAGGKYQSPCSPWRRPAAVGTAHGSSECDGVTLPAH